MLKQLSVVIALGTALAACGNQNPLRVTRSACPAVAVVQHTGDVTLFNPPSSRDANAIDVTATMTNVRGTCTEVGDQLVTGVTFDVVALRRNATGAREVTLPFFASVVQAGDKLVAKQTGTVTLHFADGQARTQTSGAARSQVSRAAATLVPEVRAKITRERKEGDPDAALDPLADPAVRQAVRNASFEVLVGFQLDEAGLAYNVSR